LVLKASLTVAGRDEIGKLIPLQREDNQKHVYLTREEVNRIASCAPMGSPLRAAIYIAAYTGLRASELLALPSTPTPSPSVMVRMSKSGKPRVVPLPSILQPYLSALPLPLSYDSLSRSFCKVRAAAGLPADVTFHTLRHSYASWMIRAGVDLVTLSKLLGHSSVQITARYAHLYDDALKVAVRKLEYAQEVRCD
jgi:integrase